MKYQPQWTKKVAMEGSGRDPLGLSRVSDALTKFLLPGIITTTDRARYYSFYTWAIDDIEKARSEQTAERKGPSFFEEFQRREAAFALASRLGSKTDLPVVGVRQVDVALASPDKSGRLDTNFRVLPSNTTGGYGQYYEGCLHGLHLVRFNEDGELIASPDKGCDLASAFAAAVSKTPYITDDWKSKDTIPKTVLEKSAKHFSLDGLSSPTAERERRLLVDLFFNLGESPTELHPLNRQATLGMLLHVLLMCNKEGIVVTRRNVDFGALFWPRYYGGLTDEEHRFLPYKPAPGFEAAHAYWQQFCAHQFTAFALEEFLAAVLDALSSHPEGLTKDALLDKLMETDFAKDLAKVLKKTCSSPAKLLGALGVKSIPDAESSEAASNAFHGRSAINEWNVCWDEAVAPETGLGRAFLLLGMLYAKWRGRVDEQSLGVVAGEAADEVWLGSIFPWLDEWLGHQPSWRDEIERMLRWTLSRHEQVKFQKRKLDASWFEVANGRFVKQQDLTPGFRASRHGNAVTILQDLGLLEHGGLDDPLKLTRSGKEVLDKVVKARS